MQGSFKAVAFCGGRQWIIMKGKGGEGERFCKQKAAQVNNRERLAWLLLF